jgi:hypothetical protein
MIAAAPGQEADTLAGNWKIMNAGRILWLVQFEAKDKGYAGSVLDVSPGFPTTKLEDLQVSPDAVRFNLRMGGRSFNIEAGLPEGGKALGTIKAEGRISLITMQRTALTGLRDPFEASKELVASQIDDPAVFEAATPLFSLAESKKATSEQVRGWADKLFRAAKAYGPRWQLEIGVRIAGPLAASKAFSAIGLEYARRTERLLEPSQDAGEQVRVLEALANALRKTGKPDEAKTVDARVEKLEQQLDQEYLKKFPHFMVTPFAGSRKSERTVLVELFTGAECPPCVAADLGFEGLRRAYAPKDVVLLQYHLHIPGPDPLANADSEARQNFYGDAIQGTPTILFNGKPQAGGGGAADDAKSKYGEYREVIDGILGSSAAAPKLVLRAERKGDRVEATAEVSDIAEPSDSLRLRFALVEEQVRYTGGNNVRFHHHVVRAMPGTAAGFAVKGKAANQSITIDLAQIRDQLGGYLADASQRMTFPSERRPLALKDLILVAFLQNDESKEILQAAQVKIRGENAD